MKRKKIIKILVTAGPVWVPIDKVRVITNIFSGNLGLKIAMNAARSGMATTLLLGPGRIMVPNKIIPNLTIKRFKYFNEIFKLIKREVSSKRYDIIIHSAAIADYQPKKVYNGKIKSGDPKFAIFFKPTVKIVDYIKHWDPKIYLVKFKVESGVSVDRLIEIAWNSMIKSNADLIVANRLEDVLASAHSAYIIDRNKNITKVVTKEKIAQMVIKTIFVKNKNA